MALSQYNLHLASYVKGLTLLLIAILAFSIRLFSVVKYESVIHEFDPYFNYRVTQFLTKEGFYNLWNWFDDRTWYPLGRGIGGTVYPGLIFTAGVMYKILHALNIPIHVQEVCVFTAPLFSAFCALAAYGLVSEVKSDGAGLLAAAFVAMVPSYISRSVAGSYDNEGVAIFALVNVFYMFVKTLKTGSLSWAVGLIMAYFYMVLSWGGYSFIINLLPLYCLVCVFSGKLTSRLYLAFTPLVAFGTLLAASIPVVGFNAILMSEHFGAFFAFVVLHAALLQRYMRATLSSKAYSAAQALVMSSLIGLFAVVFVLVAGYVAKSPTLGWTGRSMTLLDPTYASKYVPIIASVSEHQPTSWTSYIMDLHLLALLAPAGIIVCFYPLTEGSLFLVLYGVTAVYFSGVMVRLMLVLAPAVCCLAAVAVSDMFETLCGSLKSAVQSSSSSSSSSSTIEVPPVTPSDAAEVSAQEDTTKTTPTKKLSKDAPTTAGGKKEKTSKKATSSRKGSRVLYALPFPIAGAATFLLLVLLCMYTFHCIQSSSDMYSAPSIVLQSPRADGSVYVFDDFREAYAWLRHNTDPEAKVASWWDYGYQTTAMANRTVVVDNNTWNTSHIATVGRAMASPEYKAWKIYRSLDVDYVFVVFGGMVGYPSDDINKFLWMVRIGGGVYPEIKEPDYLSAQGEYRIDAQGSPTMLKSLMYKLCYYRFAEATGGFDRVRNTQIGKSDVQLKYFEEVFTSVHWMMRIYRVLDAPKREKIKLKKSIRSSAS